MTLVLLNHPLAGSTRALVPLSTYPWKGAALITTPLLSLFALKFLYICSLLMVPADLGFATRLSPSVLRSGFMEWRPVFLPSFLSLLLMLDLAMM